MFAAIRFRISATPVVAMGIVENSIRSVSFLLLLCALNSAPRAAAQVSCTVTYTCHSSGCAELVNGGSGIMVSHRTLSFASAAACTAQAKTVGDGTIASCSCGSAASSNAPAAPAGLNPALTNGAQTIGTALGQWLARSILGGGNSAPSPAEAANVAAQQQQALAAQQLNNSGIYLSKQRNYAGAINEFQQALSITPNDSNILHNLELAKQGQKNTAVAGQTSGALGQLLGTAPAGLGNSDTALNLVNVDSDPNAAGTGTTGTSPDSIQGELDGVFGNTTLTSASSNAQGVHPQAQAQDIDQLFQPSPSNPSQTAPSPSQTDAKQKQAEQKQVEDIFKDPGGTTDSAALAQQAGLGQKATAAKSDEDASGLARQGFDTAAPNVVVTQTRATQAPATAAPASVPSTAVDLSQSKQSLVPANLKTPQIAVNAAPAPAQFPITVIRSAGSGGLAAPGAPIFDCAGDRTLVIRLAAGLPAQEEAIKRTDAAMAAAAKDAEDARPEAMWAAFKTLNTAAMSISELSKSALTKVEGPKSHGIPPDAAARFRLLQDLKELGELGDTLADATEVKGKTVDSFKAGEALGNAVFVQKTARSTADKIKAIQKLLVDSGIRDEGLEEIAGNLALYGLGPIGGPIGDALVHTLANGAELVEKAGEYWNSAGEAKEAERNLTVMRYQQMQVRDRIYELQQEVAVGCPN
jgi:tetratricopeptide (TPR) repeat protein